MNRHDGEDGQDEVEEGNGRGGRVASDALARLYCLMRRLYRSYYYINTFTFLILSLKIASRNICEIFRLNIW